MSIGWSSFVTGFAKQATTLIQERDKEIQSLIDERLEEMNRAAKEARSSGASRKEELTSVSNTLISLGVPESEVASIIETQGIERAKQTAEILQKRELTGGLTPSRIQQMTAGLPKATGSLEDTMKRLSTPTVGETPPVQMERAFGLGGGRRAAEFEERAGRIATELPEMPRATAGGGLDLSVFAEEDKAPTKAEVLASYAKKINDASDDPKEVSRLQRERDLYINRGFPKDEDKEKALTFSNTTTGLQKAISQAYTANSQKLGNSTFSIADDGTIRFAPGTAQHAQFFRDLVRNTIQDTTERYTDAEGRLPEPIAAAVNFMGTAYGIRVGRDRKIVVGGAEPPTSPATPPAVSPASAPPPKGATTATKPSLEQFMIRARQANPGASDAELKKYYEDKYGNK